MSETYLFIWGTLAFLLTVGPLVAAAYLDYRDRIHKETIERAAGLHQDRVR